MGEMFPCASSTPSRGATGAAIWRRDRCSRTAERIAVATGQGALVLHTVQAEGKRRLPVEQFWRGAPGFVGAMLV